MLGIDVGRNSTKVSLLDKVITFPSVVGEWRQLRLGDTGDYVFEYNGQRFFVGEMARESFYRREMVTESKIHEETKILFLAGMALAGGGMVATGLPVYQHTPKNKAELRQLLEGRYKVVINGVSMNLDVANIQVVPEGAGAFWDSVLDDRGLVANRRLLEKDCVRVLDIGSRTINYLTILAGRYLDRDSGTLPYGCIELENGGGQKGGFARKIVADLSRHWVDFKGTDLILLTGGGALILEQAIKGHFPLAQVEVADNPVCANVKGYRKLGMIHARQN